jgi:hypothetical protein
MPTETEREYDEVEGCIGNGVEKELGGGVVEDRLEAVHVGRGHGRGRPRSSPSLAPSRNPSAS